MKYMLILRINKTNKDQTDEVLFVCWRAVLQDRKTALSFTCLLHEKEHFDHILM